MRLLLVHPGASYSTHDVFVGLHNGLLGHGVTAFPYQLDARIERAGSWLSYCWRKAGKPDPRPTDADVIYRASVEALERALRWNVDGVLIVSAMYFHPDALELIRRAHLPIGLVFTESPYDDEAQYKLAVQADVCWTNERSSVPMLRHACPRTYYLPHAYNPDVHSHLSDALVASVASHDVVFVGSYFAERLEILRAVDWSGIDLGLYGEFMRQRPGKRLAPYVRGGVQDNRVAAELYRHAAVGLNLYRRSIAFGPKARRITHADSLNPRAYELAACGVFQISDHRPEVSEVFGDSIPTFETPDQLGTLVRQYLADAKLRRQLAAEARQAVLPHTFAARAAQLKAQLRGDAWAEPMAKGA